VRLDFWDLEQPLIDALYMRSPAPQDSLPSRTEPWDRRTQENLGALTADSMRLKQILLNLLSIACKFSKDGEVGLRERKVADGCEWVELAVADSGIGISAEPAAKTVPGLHPGRTHRPALRRDMARPCETSKRGPAHF
jgi:light-regulated signal transduction histidine kinase (bacteriophytochrome)